MRSSEVWLEAHGYDVNELRAEFGNSRRSHSKYRCADGMCGAEDCSTCRPTTWQDSEDEGEEEGE